MKGRCPLFGRFAVLLASGVVAGAMLAAVLRINLAQRYPDFIAGPLALMGESSKIRDLIAGPAFVAAGFLAFWALRATVARIRTARGEQHAEELNRQLVWWSVPAVAALAGLFLQSSIDMRIVLGSAVGLAAVSLVSLLASRRSASVTPSRVGLALLGSLLLGLVPVEAAVLLGRVAGWTRDPWLLFRASQVVTALLVAAVSWTAVVHSERFDRWLPRLVAAAQLGLPLFFLTLLPADLITPGGEVIDYRATPWLPVLVLSLVGLGMVDVVRRLWRGRKDAGSVAGLLSPFAVFAVVVALRLGVTQQPYIPPDDYHFGESLLGWAYLQPAVPYVDYLPAHGLVADDLPAGFAQLFFDGTASSMQEASRLVLALFLLAGFMSLWLFTGSLGLAFVSVLFMGGPNSWLILIPFLVLWLSPALRRKPAIWLSVWVLTAPLAVLATPGWGMALVAASSVVAIKASFDLWRGSGLRGLWGPVGALALLGLLLVFTPLGPMLVGALRYAGEQGAVNQVAYGLSWPVNWTEGVPSGLFTEALRMSWLAAPAAALGAIVLAVRRRAWPALLTGTALLLFSVLLIPYAMGRIDPTGLSRPGYMAIFAWMVLVPVALWHLLDPGRRAVLLLAVAAMGAAFGFTTLNFSSFRVDALAGMEVGTLQDGAAAGLPNVGRASMQQDHWERLIRLRNLLEQELGPSQTYLDLSNRNAHYFYMDRLPLLPTTAPYNLAPVDQQQRAVESLSASPPPLVLMEADNIVHDGVAHALRVPVIFQFLMDRFEPAWSHGFVIARPGRSHQRGLKTEISIQDRTDATWHRGIHRVGPAVLLDGGFPHRALSAGSEVVLSGDRRRIARVEQEGPIVWLEGGALEDSPSASERMELILNTPEELYAFRMALWEKAFAPEHLGKLPVSWGRSTGSLSDEMTPVRRLRVSGRSAGTGPDDIAGGGTARFDLAPRGLSGDDAGLLGFDFSCSGAGKDTELHIRWSGRGPDGVHAEGELYFIAEDGRLIVPLQAYPRWAALTQVDELAIATQDPNACESIKVSNAALFQAKMLK